ncbi:CASP-like protein 5A2 [Vitis riparia]|uniref:CASP-like protein 5A2 n=1 Tax=Vitis riparia TaxID=96939 RepID=UPI00155B2E87|nr:CASP-like protein 5A2 [Vitis riparia]
MQCRQSEFRAHLWEDLYLSSLRTNHPFGWREKPGKGEKGLSKHKKKSEFHSLNCLEARKENLCSTVPDTAVLPYARMNVSHASVHPVEDPPPTDAINAPRVRMKDFQGTPGTTGGLSLRCCQFLFAAIALCVMVTTSDFSSVTAFCYLVAAVGLQSLWSLSLAILDIYALSVKRCLQNYQVVALFTIGDGITSTLTFAAACASAGITVLIGNDLNSCAHNNCLEFETATTLAFFSWFAVLPSFLLNFWSLASR